MARRRQTPDGRCGAPLTHSYQRKPQLLHHTWGHDPSNTGQLNETVLERYLKTFVEADVTVLELAATANWLVEEERRDDWQEALRRRKGPKVEGGRLDRAEALLRKVGLPLTTADASA